MFKRVSMGVKLGGITPRLTKLSAIGLCCFYAMTTPFNDFGISIALAVLVIAYLLTAVMGYWIISRRREEIRLRSELIMMNDKTERARDQARADFELRQRLLSYIGHDLRQPISAARFVLHEMSAQEVQPVTQKMISDTEECIRSAGRMIDDIVQITHYNSPDIEVLPEDIHLDTILKQTVRENTAGMKTSGTALRYVPSTVALNIDPELLTRILRNLINNANKHARAKKILLGVRHREEGIEIWVVDNGCGLSVSRSTGDTAGLGIGLEISSQLAQACGATLDLVSTPNKGTCCRLKIPNTHLI
jgi:signal transduction histidine kinase